MDVKKPLMKRQLDMLDIRLRARATTAIAGIMKYLSKNRLLQFLAKPVRRR